MNSCAHGYVITKIAEAERRAAGRLAADAARREAGADPQQAGGESRCQRTLIANRGPNADKAVAGEHLAGIEAIQAFGLHNIKGIRNTWLEDSNKIASGNHGAVQSRAYPV
jgi:hypothetical protein